MLAVSVLVLTVFSVVVCAGSSNLHLTGDDVETWTLTCNSSSIRGPFETPDFIQSVQLNADSDHRWLVRLTCNHSKGRTDPPKENESFFNYTALPATQFTRGYDSGACASAFLQLFTVGHPHCSSQSPRLGSVESRLRNLHYQCAFTFVHGISSENYSTAEFEARNYTKLICCVGDGCETGGGNGTNNRVTTDYKYLQMVISHIRKNNDKIERCRVITGDNKSTDGNVFSKGRLNDTGARLECHVPSELDCAEFQCQVVTGTGETFTQTLKHSKLNENQYCWKGDSLVDSEKQELVPIAVAVPLSVALVAAIGVLVCRHRRNGSNTVPGSPSSPDTNTTEEHPLNANNADNDNGHCDDTC